MNADATARILQLLDDCEDLTLATVRPDGTPQANIVNFAHEGLEIFVATDRASAKVRNLLAAERVALALRSEYSRWSEVRGLSIDALGEVLADDSAGAQRAKDCLARRFPDTVSTPTPQDPATTVYLKLTPVRIVLIDYEQGYGHRETHRVAALS
jgi:general stress protein 26